MSIGIYKITNKINGKAYIGQSRKIEQRFHEHIYANTSSLIHKAIIKYGQNNFTFEILEECSAEELNEKEIYWIKYYDTYENGYNLTLGGDTGYLYDPQAIYNDYLLTNSIAQTAKNIGCHETTVRTILHSCYNINKSDLQEAKAIDKIDPTTLEVITTYKSINDAARAVNVHKSAIQLALKGETQSCANYYWKYHDENKDFSNYHITSWKKKVIQYDLQGNQICVYDSIIEAAKTLKGDNPENKVPSICAVCTGKKISAYGYKWSYYGEPLPDTFYKQPKSKKVNQYDLNGNFIRSFNSIKEANISFNKNPDASSINKVCKGQAKTAYGYLWEYAN